MHFARARAERANDSSVGTVSAQGDQGAATGFKESVDSRFSIFSGIANSRFKYVYPGLQRHMLQRRRSNSEGLSGDEDICGPERVRTRRNPRDDVALRLVGHVCGPCGQATDVPAGHRVHADCYGYFSHL